MQAYPKVNWSTFGGTDLVRVSAILAPKSILYCCQRAYSPFQALIGDTFELIHPTDLPLSVSRTAQAPDDRAPPGQKTPAEKVNRGVR